MEKFKVSKLKWDKVGTKIKSVNPDFHSVINSIARQLNSTGRDFIFSLKLKFGQKFIQDGKMIALAKDFDKKYINTTLLSFSENNEENEKAIDEFLACVGNTAGHPLSIITENYIEIFCENYSPYCLPGGEAYSKKYFFPLNQLKQGDVFGVWEAINLIFNYSDHNFEGWDAVAGKNCFISILPVNKSGVSSAEYRAEFSDIFKNMVTSEEGFVSLVNEKYGKDYFTEILIIPEHFYMYSKGDNENMQLSKSKLREFIFKTGWQQEEKIKIPNWNDWESLLKGLDKKDIGLIYTLKQHFINIVTSKAFGIKPIDNNDPLFFEVVSDLVKKFRTIKTGRKKDKTLLDYCFPLFFHYTLFDTNDWIFEISHSPSINVVLPPIKLDDFKPTFENQFINGDKLKKLFENFGINTDVTFYAKPSKKSGKKIKTMEDFIQENIASIYSHLLVEEENFITNFDHWFFNGLTVIKKVK